MIALADETWLPVVGLETRYEVSSFGQVRSCDMLLAQRKGEGLRLLRGKILKQDTESRTGYKVVTLCPNSEVRKRFRVHTLVLKAFVGPRPPGMVSRHLDDEPASNLLTNLCWGTQRENMADAKRNGCAPSSENNPRGSVHWKAKLTEADIPTIRARAASGESLQLISDSYGVTRANVGYVVSRKTWSHIA